MDSKIDKQVKSNRTPKKISCEQRAQTSYNERLFRTIYDIAPISILISDWSATIEMIDRLKREGVGDFRTYFFEHSELVSEARCSIKTLDFNPRASEIFLIENKEKLLSRGWTLFQTENSQPGFLNLLCSLAEGRANHVSEMDMVGQTGAPMRVICSATFPLPDAKHGLVILCVDNVSSLHRMNSALKDYEQGFELLMQSTSNALVLVNKEGVISRSNGHAESLFGYDAGELLGVSADHIMPTLLDAMRNGDATNTAARAMKQSKTLTARRKNGSEFYIEVSLSPVTISDEFFYIAAVVDVTQRRLADWELERSERRQALAMETAQLGAWEYSENEKIFFFDERAAHHLQLSRSAVSAEELLRILTVDSPDLFVENLTKKRNSQLSMIDAQVILATGESRYFEFVGRARNPSDHGWGDNISHYGTVQNITERKLTSEALQDSEETYRLVMETTSDGFLMIDSLGNILEVNDSYLKRSGYSRQEMIGMHITDLDFMDGASRISTVVEIGIDSYETEHRSKSGEMCPIEVTASYTPAHGGRIFCFTRDIASRKRAEEEIRRLAYYDVLTGLPNRRLLQDRIRRAMSMSERTSRNCALMFIDLDNFKMLNDTHGHDTGDKLLVSVARRLQSCVREVDTISRIGGDEFVIVLEGLSSDLNFAAAQTYQIGEKLLLILGQNYNLGSIKHYTTASIGVAMFAKKELTVEEIMKRADLAMYQAKLDGKDTIRFYDNHMQETIRARTMINSELREGINRGELEIYFQPQVDAIGTIIGAEALLRWNHPTRGVVEPRGFISIAEDTGLIERVGRCVLEQACSALGRWSHDPHLKDLTLSVNVSPRQFYQQDFVKQIKSALFSFQVSPCSLKLELTESILLQDVQDTTDKMNALREIGVKFALDDFGTGYSSLAYLKRLPLDQIKIAQSFIHDLHTNPNGAAISHAVIALGVSLGLNVIAEGVETEDQWRFLLNEGCPEGQGFLFGKPTVEADFTALVYQGTKRFTFSKGIETSLNGNATVVGDSNKATIHL